jgi:hypothetical protein
MPAASLASRARVVALVVSLFSLPVGALADNGTDTLLTVDRQRPQLIERIVETWGAKIAQSSSPLSIDELRIRLQGLRADRLLAASLATSPDALRGVIHDGPPAKPALADGKALGDATIDSVYTPVTPCRLVETRGVFAAVYQGDGSPAHTPLPFTANQIRTYTVQGGNNVCLTQLPAGLDPSAVQLQVFGMPTTRSRATSRSCPRARRSGRRRPWCMSRASPSTRCRRRHASIPRTTRSACRCAAAERTSRSTSSGTSRPRPMRPP